MAVAGFQLPFVVQGRELRGNDLVMMTNGQISIESADGATVRARVFFPEVVGHASPVCVVLPAMGVRASFYGAFAMALAEQGIPAVTVDLRGQGESSERAVRGASFAYREITALDLPAAVSAVRDRFPDRSLVLVGHSLGGQLATLSLARGTVHADGLVLVTAGTAHWRAWPRGARAKAGAVVLGVSFAGRWLRYYPGSRLGFGGDQPRALMHDWSRNAFTGEYPLEPTAALSGLPVLSLELEGDPVAPPGATRELLSRIDPSWVSRRTFPPSGPGEPWKQHFAWAREPARVVGEMKAWFCDGRRLRLSA